MNFAAPPAETLRIGEVHKLYRCVVHVRRRVPPAAQTIALTYFLRQPVCPRVVAAAVTECWGAAADAIAPEPVLFKPAPIYALLDASAGVFVVLNRGGDLTDAEEAFLCGLSDRERRRQKRWMAPGAIPTDKVYDLSDAAERARWRAAVGRLAGRLAGGGGGDGA